MRPKKPIVTKICENVLCGKRYIPHPNQQKRQRFCKECGKTRGKNPEPILMRPCENCLAMFTPRACQKDRQRFCCTECGIEFERKDAIERGAKNMKADKGIDARCPLCRRVHRVYKVNGYPIIWEQKSMPWVFCTKCQQVRESADFEGMEEETNHRVYFF